jgi:hypothetical protein
VARERTEVRARRRHTAAAEVGCSDCCPGTAGTGPRREFRLPPPADATLAGTLALWQEEVRASRAAAAHIPLDTTGDFGGTPVSLRWIYVHMIEEYARHNGHADLIRERIDGLTGV